MFSNSGNSFDPFDHQYFNQTTIGNSYNTQNPSSSTHQENHSSPILYFPSTPPFDFEDGDHLLASKFLSREQEVEILSSRTTLQAEAAAAHQEVNHVSSPNSGARNNNAVKKKKSGNGTNAAKQPAVPRRRTGKKDRHSKIFTAQGPRDRRMRLSLPIARKFFDLQDMLGFDKASKTIEWLFTKSRAAIKEFGKSCSTSGATGGKSAASTSESEVVSGSVKLTADNGESICAVAGEAGDSSVSINPREKKSKLRSHKQVCNLISRESRDKARTRARERTRDKMKIKGPDNPPELSSHRSTSPNKLEQLVLSSGSLQNGEISLVSSSQEIVHPLKMIQEEESNTYMLQNQMDTVSLVDKFLGTTSAPRSSTFDFSYTIPVRSGAALEEELTDQFPVNWEIMTNSKHRHNTMPNMKPVTGNVHAQNPNAIVLTPSCPQQQYTSPKSQQLAVAQEENGSSVVFMNISNPSEPNPTDTYSHFIENQVFYNPIVPHKYGSLY
ncbi:hypothetical protein Tsubulata_030154 [Turnera subulata]|uniref:TCP domain-containing protein n=1 Tax=Turnera subulata TaxID=218843 RepID=A0A9Q0FXS0_9ROSI|nr:hypothetical protein Tsubulata_030154 [Turnera subulata]